MFLAEFSIRNHVICEQEVNWVLKSFWWPVWPGAYVAIDREIERKSEQLLVEGRRSIEFARCMIIMVPVFHLVILQDFNHV